MQLVLDDVEALAPVVLHPGPMTDDEFFDFCMRYREYRVECSEDGEIIIMPPAGFETGFRNNDLSRQLGNWAAEDGRGEAFDSNTEYVLPNGARRSPDASWVSREKIDGLQRESRRRFPRLCPDFVIELRSPTDRKSPLVRKMNEWIQNGAQLGWLVDPEDMTLTVFRPGLPPEVLAKPERMAGEGPVAGLAMHMGRIWAGL